jgi:hypothetical protein
MEWAQKPGWSVANNAVYASRMRLTKLVFAGLLLAIPAAVAACGKNSLGDPCEHLADPDECEDGSICAKELNGENVCLKVCASDADCSSDRACNGVTSTNVKACRKK